MELKKLSNYFESLVTLHNIAVSRGDDDGVTRISGRLQSAVKVSAIFGYVVRYYFLGDVSYHKIIKLEFCKDGELVRYVEDFRYREDCSDLLD